MRIKQYTDSTQQLMYLFKNLWPSITIDVIRCIIRDVLLGIFKAHCDAVDSECHTRACSLCVAVY